MRVLRVTRKDGHAWTVPIEQDRINVGRDPDNELVLEDEAVSRHHCLIERQGPHILVKDRGTPNGTFVNNEFLSEPRELREGDRVYVGPFLLELVALAQEGHHAVRVASPMGPVLRPRTTSPDDRYGQRLLQWAQHWNGGGRPKSELLRGRLLTEAQTHLRSGPADPIVRAFVAASGRRRAAGRFGLTMGVLAVLGLVGGGLWLTRPWEGESDPEEVASAAPQEESSLEPVPLRRSKPVEPQVELTWVEHEVIPAESIEDIARRYGATVSNVARWNGLNPDAPTLEVGRKLRVHAEKTPLPQQKIDFELDRDYDWKSLSERFDVEPDKLRAYNPEVVELESGLRISVWINPKPYARRSKALEFPEFQIRPDALSIGAPNDGGLKNGVQMPESPLYTRRAPSIMWGSSHTIETLLKAIARFRQDLAFDHELVLADMSRRNGGKFKPHKSHQAGRDIDIWMPTLKGVYKEKYLSRTNRTKIRRPKVNEIDWYATWGLVRALLETDEIVKIFLEYSMQEKLYRAAEEMGATEEELAKIQWPRGSRSGGAIIAHSAGHITHIHVRFRCAKADIDCKHNIRAHLSDDQ